MRSVSRFNPVRDLLSKYVRTVTVSERQERLSPEKVEESFLKTFFPLRIRSAGGLFGTCWEVTGDVLTRKPIKL